MAVDQLLRLLVTAKRVDEAIRIGRESMSYMTYKQAVGGTLGWINVLRGKSPKLAGHVLGESTPAHSVRAIGDFGDAINSFLDSLRESGLQATSVERFSAVMRNDPLFSFLRLPTRESFRDENRLGLTLAYISMGKYSAAYSTCKVATSDSLAPGKKILLSWAQAVACNLVGNYEEAVAACKSSWIKCSDSRWLALLGQGTHHQKRISNLVSYPASFE